MWNAAEKVCYSCARKKSTMKNTSATVEMRKTMKVSRDGFEAAIKRLANTPPIKRADIKTSGKRGSKKPILAK